MPSGGIFGRPVIIDGVNAAVAGVNPGPAPGSGSPAENLAPFLVSPYSGRKNFSRRIKVRVGATALRLFVNNQPMLILAASSEYEDEMLVYDLAVQSDGAGTAPYDMTLTMAA